MGGGSGAIPCAAKDFIYELPGPAKRLSSNFLAAS